MYSRCRLAGEQGGQAACAAVIDADGVTPLCGFSQVRGWRSALPPMQLSSAAVDTHPLSRRGGRAGLLDRLVPPVRLLRLVLPHTHGGARAHRRQHLRQRQHAGGDVRPQRGVLLDVRGQRGPRGGASWRCLPWRSGPLCPPCAHPPTCTPAVTLSTFAHAPRPSTDACNSLINADLCWRSPACAWHNSQGGGPGWCSARRDPCFDLRCAGAGGRMAECIANPHRCIKSRGWHPPTTHTHRALPPQQRCRCLHCQPQLQGGTALRARLLRGGRLLLPGP